MKMTVSSPYEGTLKVEGEHITPFFLTLQDANELADKLLETVREQYQLQRESCYQQQLDEQRLTNGFDYTNQAWVVDGRYVSCGHHEAMICNCFGRIHAGESPAANAEIH